METKKESSTIYCTINECAKLTGISRCAIREMCRNGTIPCLRFGNGKNAVYKIHYQKFVEQLEREVVNGGG